MEHSCCFCGDVSWSLRVRYNRASCRWVFTSLKQSNHIVGSVIGAALPSIAAGPLTAAWSEAPLEVVAVMPVGRFKKLRHNGESLHLESSASLIALIYRSNPCLRSSRWVGLETVWTKYLFPGKGAGGGPETWATRDLWNSRNSEYRFWTVYDRRGSRTLILYKVYLLEVFDSVVSGIESSRLGAITPASRAPNSNFSALVRPMQQNDCWSRDPWSLFEDLTRHGTGTWRDEKRRRFRLRLTVQVPWCDTERRTKVICVNITQISSIYCVYCTCPARWRERWLLRDSDRDGGADSMLRHITTACLAHCSTYALAAVALSWRCS